jgi:hypothetical protein
MEARVVYYYINFLKPTRALLEPARAATLGVDGRDAWSALVASGILPESFRDDPARRFLSNGELVAAPTELETCLALGSDVPGVLRAESRCRTILALLARLSPGRCLEPQTGVVVWDDGAYATDCDAFQIATWSREVTDLWLRNFTRNAAVAVVGAEILCNELERAICAELVALFATGYSVTCYPAEPGVDPGDLIVLCAPPLPAR